MVLAMVGMHRRPFIVAVTGAAIFATCTVLSSIAVQWVTDNVILPRFEEGEVETSTLVTGVLFIGAVGVVRAVGVVLRRVVCRDHPIPRRGDAGERCRRSTRSPADRLASAPSRR